MKIVVAGATGFLGTQLVRLLLQGSHDITILSRDGVRARSHFNSAVSAAAWRDKSAVASAIAAADVVVNLSGESIAGKRWDDDFKKALHDSRIGPTEAIVAARPKVLIQASAVGFYGECGDREITEETPHGDDFLTKLCVDWEQAALAANNDGARVVLVRIGQVLGLGGGALASMLNPPMVPFSPFRAGLGGPLGSGKQWMPWIHEADVIGLFHTAIFDERYVGPINATAPNPVTGKEFATALGSVLGKPAIVPVPAFALRALLGEFADYLVQSQRVLPTMALRLGYRFQYPELAPALANLL